MIVVLFLGFILFIGLIIVSIVLALAYMTRKKPAVSIAISQSEVELSLDEKLSLNNIKRGSIAEMLHKPFATAEQITLADDFIIERYSKGTKFRAIHHEFGDLGVYTDTIEGIYKAIDIFKVEYEQEFLELEKLSSKKVRRSEILNVRFIK